MPQPQLSLPSAALGWPGAPYGGGVFAPGGPPPAAVAAAAAAHAQQAGAGGEALYSVRATRAKTPTAKAAAEPEKKPARSRAKSGGAGKDGAAAPARGAKRSAPAAAEDIGEGDDGRQLTHEEIRRQRRMLSNRESARRSRRRKLEHVSTLEDQLTRLQDDLELTRSRLMDSERRYETTLRDCAALRAEVDRLSAAAGPAGALPNGAAAAAAALPRIGSENALSKLVRGEGDGEGERRGFVPFRSLKSYENLLKLQQQARLAQASVPSEGVSNGKDDDDNDDDDEDEDDDADQDAGNDDEEGDEEDAGKDESS